MLGSSRRSRPCILTAWSSTSSDWRTTPSAASSGKSSHLSSRGWHPSHGTLRCRRGDQPLRACAGRARSSAQGPAARRAGDRRRLGWVSAYSALYLRFRVGIPQGVETGERAIAIASELDDLSLRVVATDTVAAPTTKWDNSTARSSSTANIGALDGATLVEHGRQYVTAVVSSRSFLSLCLGWQGNFHEALTCAEEALRIAEERNHAQTIASASNMGSLVAALSGDIALAVRRAEQSVAIREAVGLPLHPQRGRFLAMLTSWRGGPTRPCRNWNRARAGGRVAAPRVHITLDRLMATTYRRAGRPTRHKGQRRRLVRWPRRPMSAASSDMPFTSSARSRLMASIPMWTARRVNTAGA